MDERYEGPADEPGQGTPDAGTDAEGATASGPAGTDGGWSGDAGSASPRGREWLRQLETMIEEVATQAAPTIRQIGIKAAELAAVAGERAGPFAQKAAEVTGDAGLRLAERSRALADELRRDAADAAGGAPDAETTAEAEAAESTAPEPPSDLPPA